MYIEQLYTNCLSEAAYFIESEGEVAIIDPLRDIDKYIQMASDRKATIKYIFETHFHADFVSGHLDLAEKTGAKIIYGPNAKTDFDKWDAKDGEEFTLGQCTFRVIHTPGHTLESTCYLLLNENKTPHCLFTGDTLFVGDVGRPDLFSGNLTKEELASMMYESLNSIKQLPPELIIYPAHGPGSSCGKNLGPNTYTTLQEQMETNYALQPQTKEAFVKAVTEGLTTPPRYFAINASINKKGYTSIDKVKEKGMTALSVADFKALQENSIIIDSRKATDFTTCFIPGSISIGLEGRFAEWAGALIPFDKDILLVTEIGKEEETLVRLTRVGFEHIHGYLDGGIEAWKNAGEKIDLIIDIEPDELKMDINYDFNAIVLDVRKEVEYNNGHVTSAVNFPLQDFTDIARISDFEDTDNIYIHCAGGYRSVIAASIFKKEGIHNIRNVLGGYDAIKKIEGMPLASAKELLN